ncbi:hypothetical protein [Flavivirga amylovorans]|nr:hypothetical protein [Flavivirga amylovorans]
MRDNYEIISKEITEIKTFHNLMSFFSKIRLFVDKTVNEIQEHNHSEMLWNMVLVFHSNLLADLFHKFRTIDLKVVTVYKNYENSKNQNSIASIISKIDQLLNRSQKIKLISNLFILGELHFVDKLISEKKTNKNLVFNIMLPSFSHNYFKLILGLPKEYLDHLISIDYKPKPKKVLQKQKKSIAIDFTLCNTSFYYDFNQYLIRAILTKNKEYLNKASSFIKEYINFMTSKKDDHIIPNTDILKITKDFNLSSVIKALKYAIFYEPDYPEMTEAELLYLGNHHHFSLKSDPIDRTFTLIIPNYTFFTNSSMNPIELEEIFIEHKKNDFSFLENYQNQIKNSNAILKLNDLNLIIDDILINEIYYDKFVKSTKTTVSISSIFISVYFLEKFKIENSEFMASLKFLIQLYLGHIGIKRINDINTKMD